MKIQTFSVVVGNSACNAKCPFCVAKMTPKCDVSNDKVNWRNFDIGCRFALNSGVSTVLLTGKGEPTLFPELITEYLKHISPQFPFIELQTNGFKLTDDSFDHYLKEWYELGLTTVCLSIVHWDEYENNKVYKFKNTYSLEALISKLHKFGFSVRFSCMLLKGFIDSPNGLVNLIRFAKRNKVEQLTVRSISKPEESKDKVGQWVNKNRINETDLEMIQSVALSTFKTTKLMELVHGAIVYDADGQNICLSNCLTRAPEEKETIRQLIFIANHLRYDWVYEGAILL